MGWARKVGPGSTCLASCVTIQVAWPHASAWCGAACRACVQVRIWRSGRARTVQAGVEHDCVLLWKMGTCDRDNLIDDAYNAWSQTSTFTNALLA